MWRQEITVASDDADLSMAGGCGAAVRTPAPLAALLQLGATSLGSGAAASASKRRLTAKTCEK